MALQLKLGTILNNKYRVGDVIANGGFGTVYLADISYGSSTNYLIYDDLNQNKKCLAIKRINTKYTRHKDILTKTENEIRIHKMLHHKYIVKFIEAFSDSESVNIVMEYCPNGTLFSLLNDFKSFSETDTRCYIYQLLIGLQYIHENNIIHRDIKLSNLLLDSNNTLKIGDFGLAVLLRNNKEERHSVCGTPEYLSPEMVKSEERTYSQAVDVWAVGCIMFHLLTGESPFKCNNDKNTLARISFLDYVIPDNGNTMSAAACDLIRHILVEKKKRYTIQQILDSKFMKSSSDIMTNSLSVSGSIDEVSKTYQNNYLIESNKSTPITSPYKDNNNNNNNNNNKDDNYITNVNTVIMDNNNDNNNNRNIMKVNKLLPFYTSFPPFDLSFITTPKKKLSEFGYIQILKSKKIRIYFKEDDTGIQIQNDGLTVCLCKEKNKPITCSISQVPNNWENKMRFCYKVINCFKSFVPRVIVQSPKYICKLMSNSPLPDFVYTTINYRFYFYMNKNYVRINDLHNEKSSVSYHSFHPNKDGNYVVDKRNCTSAFCNCSMKKEIRFDGDKDGEEDEDDDVYNEIEVSKYANPIPYEFSGYVMDGFRNYKFCLKIKEKYGKNVNGTIKVNVK